MPNLYASLLYKPWSISSMFYERIFHMKITNPKHSFDVFGAKILFIKCMRQTLMKLTAGVNFINISRAHFWYKSLLSSFSLLRVWLWTNFSVCKMLMQLTPGVSNLLLLKGRINMKKCSTGHRLKKKGPCRLLQFIEEGSEGHASYQIWSFISLHLSQLKDVLSLRAACLRSLLYSEHQKDQHESAGARVASSKKII